MRLEGFNKNFIARVTKFSDLFLTNFTDWKPLSPEQKSIETHP